MRTSTFCLMLTLTIALATPLKAVIVVPPAATEAGTPTKADVAAAKAEHKAMLKAMTPAERRAYKRNQKRELKKIISQYKKDAASGERGAEIDQTALIILCLIPPLAVYLHQGETNSKFWISLLLTLLVWVPGIIYAVLVVTGNAKK